MSGNPDWGIRGWFNQPRNEAQFTTTNGNAITANNTAST